MTTPSGSYVRVTIRVETMTPQPSDAQGYQPSDKAAQSAEVVCTGADEESALLQAQSHIAVLVDYYTPGPVPR